MLFLDIAQSVRSLQPITSHSSRARPTLERLVAPHQSSKKGEREPVTKLGFGSRVLRRVSLARLAVFPRRQSAAGRQPIQNPPRLERIPSMECYA